MADDLGDILTAQGPQPGRPLLGLTVLVVEDSRFACEALRLLCLRSGARIRRADCLQSARRHLQTYRPTVVIVDLGLPDGSGLELITELAERRPRVSVLLGTSGDSGGRATAKAAGADGFLDKPVESLAAFQTAVLSALPACGDYVGTPGLSDPVKPDRIALRDDLAMAATLLETGTDARRLDYVAQFLSGVALAAHDQPLADAAQMLAADPERGIGPLSGLVRRRLAAGQGF
ncbi:MAG: response regulator [Rhodobacteraceae bacterium]|nr:response regulator [Paracoccaceae bacterium]